MNPRKVLGIGWSYLSNTGLIPNDKLYLNVAFFLSQGKKLQLSNPQTFQEKMQWLKLYDRRPEYTIWADKVKAKEYVASVIGEEHIIPTLGVWDNPDDIDFDQLPEKFVLKCNHNSGLGMYICKSRSTFDEKKVRENLKKGLRENYYLHNREWPYKDIPRKILAEKYMEDSGAPKGLADYKFFCFNGEPKFCQVIRDRTTSETIDFYDMEWNHQVFYGLNPVARNGNTPVARPVHLEKMIEICKQLSSDSPFVRVDLYVISNTEYFGEITFFPAGGLGTFDPKDWNLILGNMITLPGIKRGG